MCSGKSICWIEWSGGNVIDRFGFQKNLSVVERKYQEEKDCIEYSGLTIQEIKKKNKDKYYAERVFNNILSGIPIFPMSWNAAAICKSEISCLDSFKKLANAMHKRVTLLECSSV